MKIFNKQIFSVPIFSGVVENKKVIEESKDLLKNWKNAFYEKINNDQSTFPGLMSYHWDLQSESNNSKDFEKFGMTTFYSGSLTDKPEWNNITEVLIASIFSLLKEDYFGDICITNMWATIYTNNAYVPEHIHNNSLYSGVFYVKTPKNCGNLVFKDPSYIAKTMSSKLNSDFPSVSIIHEQVVEEGLIVLFPSWLPHYSQPNQSDDDRIIISFNLDFPS